MQTGQHTARLVEELRDGDAAALDRLLPLVYDELRGIAHRELRRGRPASTLDTTALVHEAYLKLADRACVRPADRTHFLGIAARAMRQVLVDHARRHAAAKRGGGARSVTLDEGAMAAPLADERADALLALDEALTRLAALSERLGRVVECRFVGGLSEQETADALGVTTRTVRRDWVKARAWLHRELHDEAT